MFNKRKEIFFKNNLMKYFSINNKDIISKELVTQLQERVSIFDVKKDTDKFKEQLNKFK